MIQTFIGREQELAILEEALARYEQGKGSVIFIGGEAGFGKTFLLSEFQRRVEKHKHRQIWKADCDKDTGLENPNHPFKELVELFKNSKKITSFFAEALPEAMLSVPIFGEFLKVKAKNSMSVTAFSYPVIDNASAVRNKKLLGEQIIKTIKKIFTNGINPIVIEDVHWIDKSSVEHVISIASMLETKPGLMILSYRPFEVNPEQNESFYLAMHQKILTQNHCREIVLSEFSIDEVASYLTQKYGWKQVQSISTYLHFVCRGNPYYIKLYSDVLKQDKDLLKKIKFYAEEQMCSKNGSFLLKIAPFEMGIPMSIQAALNVRINKLKEEEQLWLKAASVQGYKFDCDLLFEWFKDTNRNKQEMLEKLKQVSNRYRIIRLLTEGRINQFSDCYEFEHILMREAFYKQLTNGQKAYYHKRSANALIEAIKEPGQQIRKNFLGIAFHLSKSGNFIDAAEYYYDAATSCLQEGAFAEPTSICHKIYELLNNRKNFSDREHGLYARTAHLNILTDWPNNVEQFKQKLELAKDSVEKAKLAKDMDTYVLLNTQLCYINLGLGKLSDALVHSRKAMEVAKGLDNTLLYCISMFIHGQETSKVDLREGIKIRRNAFKIYEDKLKDSKYSGFDFDTKVAGLLKRLGVGEFDVGNYGKALKCLHDAINLLKRHKLDNSIEYMSSPLNYLAQLEIAIGIYSQAEETLNQALNLFSDRGIKHNPWRGNNYALLAKMYLERGEYQKAEKPMKKGWIESLRTRQADLITIVGNYYGELLMNTGYSGFDLKKAKKIVTDNLDYCKRTGMLRSEVVCYSLLSRVAGLEGDVKEACGYGKKATDILKEVGDLPTVRTEEVQYYYYLLLKQMGQIDLAHQHLESAWKVTKNKADTISNKRMRDTFLTKVQINQKIFSSYQQDIQPS